MTGERGNGEQSENGVEQLFQLADRFNPAIETAAGDLRDLLIDVQRGMTKPWDDLLQIDQEARVRPSELSAEKVTRKLAFPLLSSAFGAKVEQVNVKEKGVEAKFGILHDSDEVRVSNRQLRRLSDGIEVSSNKPSAEDPAEGYRSHLEKGFVSKTAANQQLKSRRASIAFLAPRGRQ
jgi:hypothetical protein